MDCVQFISQVLCSMTERLRFTLGLVNDWLRFAETKNGAIIVVNAGAVLAIVKFTQELSWNTPAGIWVFAMALLLSVSGVIAMISFLPDILPKRKSPIRCPRKDGNLLFFRDLAYYDKLSLLEAIAEQEESSVPQNSAVLEDYAEQIITNSQIALRKYNFFRWAAWITIAGIITPIVAGALFVVFTCYQRR